MADKLFNSFNSCPLIGCSQCQGSAFAPSAAGPPDPMHVILGMMRHIEIKHMAQSADIEAAGSDIRTNQQLQFTSLEFFQSHETQRLRHVAVQCACRELVAQ